MDLSPATQDLALDMKNTFPSMLDGHCQRIIDNRKQSNDPITEDDQAFLDWAWSHSRPAERIHEQILAANANYLNSALSTFQICHRPVYVCEQQIMDRVADKYQEMDKHINDGVPLPSRSFRLQYQDMASKEILANMHGYDLELLDDTPLVMRIHRMYFDDKSIDCMDVIAKTIDNQNLHFQHYTKFDATEIGTFQWLLGPQSEDLAKYAMDANMDLNRQTVSHILNLNMDIAERFSQGDQLAYFHTYMVNQSAGVLLYFRDKPEMFTRHVTPLPSDVTPEPELPIDPDEMDATIEGVLNSSGQSPTIH